MTHDEYMKSVDEALDKYLHKLKKNIMIFVGGGWSEGMRAAETEKVEKLIKEAVEKLAPAPVEEEEELVEDYSDFTGVKPAPAWNGSWAEKEAIRWDSNDIGYVPDACKACPNHPSNGGSGVCNCTLGSPKATC